MDLKKHGYWVAMGVLGAIAGILYIVLVVMGVSADAKKKSAQLTTTLNALAKFSKIEVPEDPSKGMPIPAMVEYWRERKKALAEDVKKIEEKYRARNEAFRRKPQVALAEFTSGLRTQTDNELAKPYKALLEGADLNKIMPICDPTPQTDADAIFAQKKFYIGKALLEAAKEAKAKVLVEGKFKEPEKSGDAKTAPKGVEAIEVEATFKMPATRVATLVSHLLRTQLATFEVKEISMEAIPFHYPELDPWKVFEMPQTPQGAPIAGAQWKSFPANVFFGLQDTSDPKSKNRPAELVGDKLPEPAVQVHLVLHALDFNFPEKKN